MKKGKILAVLLIVFLLCDIFRLSAFANSAKMEWFGTGVMEVTPKDENCPLEVLHEQLTFDISEFPETYYSEKSDFLKYSGKVTAEYTFYNPANYTVTATLAFPFGYYPTYGYNAYQNSEIASMGEDAYKCNIKANDVNIDKKIRYTFLSGWYDFRIHEDIVKIQDGFVKDRFYSPDMPVTKYVYRVNSFENHENNLTVAIKIRQINGSRRYWLEEHTGFTPDEEGNGKLFQSIENDSNITLYVIGEPLKETPQFEIYEDMEIFPEDKIKGKVALVQTETMSFRDLIFSKYDKNLGIPESDWYNAILYLFNKCSIDKGVVLTDIEDPLDISRYLMRWYEYEITLKPNEKLINAVEAPIYPDINLRYNPGVYSYEYLLSPASTWAKFGSLNVDIKTPFYLLKEKSDKDIKAENFVKTNYGYNFKSDGLPQGEFVFSLCESDKPEKKYKLELMDFFFPFIVGILWYVGMGILTVIMVILAIIGIKKLLRK